ncbi:MAG TPA: polynucleotide kinase-phosphatase [Ktedonobacterales bacterium]|jgi:protein phosphatase
MSDSPQEIQQAAPAPTAVRDRNTLEIPEVCLVVLIGASGSGKSTFAARHFKPTEILSSDHYRGVVGDNPNDQTLSKPAFEALHTIAGIRLRLGKLTVIDATNVKPQDRAELLKIAREHDVLAEAIVLNVPERVCQERNAARPDRQFGPHVVRNHIKALHMGLRGMEREGFRSVTVLSSVEAIDAASIVRVPLWSDRRSEIGPFDIIGDIHGCLDEMLELLAQLGYQPDESSGLHHPDGRRVIFLGDLVDRGPKIVETVRLVQSMVAAGQAFCVPGNHDMKLLRYLKGHKVQMTHGLPETVAQLDALPAEERATWVAEYQAFMDSLVAHLALDGGQLVVAHAGMKEAYQGRASGRVRAFALFGETTGETDEFGLPVRANWAADYRGRAAVIYGHTPVPAPGWLNNTINIDTGCVFGGQLTALRWPERALVSVPARQVYMQPVRPLVVEQPAASAGESSTDILLRIEDVLGKQIISTRLTGNIIVEADRAAAALEVISRFALDPRWLIYLPPTMSPSETSTQPGWLEHPAEAFAYYRQQGVPRVICEEKHMGSRAVLVVCRDSKAAQQRFGVSEDGPIGVCYTRTGRRFFDDDAVDRELIARVSVALGSAGFWERFETDWVCLDAELLPWSAKAQGLIRGQYAPVSSAGKAALTSALATVEAAASRGLALEPLLERLRGRKETIGRYAAAYRAYCWDVSGLEGVRLAPFHLLATEGRTHLDRDHLWHMAELARLAEVDPLFLATAHRLVDVLDETSCTEAADWWLELTGRGGEGMVVKPLDFIVRGSRGVMQPAVKCRGREYLRIIYGPDYTEPENLERLRRRGLAGKRNLAMREFALGVESLERFVRGEPLWRVHQAVFGVLALESEPVDPRL